jgi:hypothetical protein
MDNGGLQSPSYDNSLFSSAWAPLKSMFCWWSLGFFPTPRPLSLEVIRQVGVLGHEMVTGLKNYDIPARWFDDWGFSAIFQGDLGILKKISQMLVWILWFGG